MFLKEEDRRWRLSLSNFELDLLIRSLDRTKSQRISDRDNETLDKIWKNLWGNRKRFSMQIHRDFCKVCNVTLKSSAGEVHEHEKNPLFVVQHALYLKPTSIGWAVDLGSYELDLLIRHLDDEIELNDEDESNLDRMLKLLWGIRRRHVVEIPEQTQEVSDDTSISDEELSEHHD